MGRRRAATAHAHPASTVTLIYDEHAAAAAELAAECGAAVAASREELIAADLDIAVVATTHDALAPISTAALLAGKHVLCEKPLGRNPREARQAVIAAEQSGRVLKVGYNHRYHPAIQKLHEVCTAGEIGPLLSIRARYGHGGRPGYDREWRTNPAKAGGGELLDQGAHLIDLAKWLLGGLCRSRRLCRDPFLGFTRGGQTPTDSFARPPGRSPRYTRVGRSGKTSSASRFSDATAMSPPRAWGEPTGRNAPSWGGAIPKVGAPKQRVHFDYPGEDRSWETGVGRFFARPSRRGHPLFAWTGGFGDYRVDLPTLPGCCRGARRATRRTSNHIEKKELQRV